MRVSFMQRVDYWFGVPLCFLLSIVNRLLCFLFTPHGTRVEPRRILFLELSEMGSAIIAHSAIVRALTEYKDSEVYFLVFERNREGVDLLSLIPKENILSVKDTGLLPFAFSMIRTLLKIRQLGIDSVIDLELFSRCTALISFLSGAANRAGFDNGLSEWLYRGSFLTHRVFYNHHQHMSVNFMALVMSLKGAQQSPLLKQNVSGLVKAPPYLEISQAEKEESWQVLMEANPAVRRGASLVILNPDPGLLALRGWPLERFSQLAERLLKELPDTVIVIVGLGRSKAVAASIAQHVPAERLVDLCGKTPTLRSLVALFSISQALITNDSGPAHMASLSPIRNFVLFGPETPALYGPLGDRAHSFFAGLSCSPCYAASNHRRSACRDNKCLQAIDVDTVFEVVSKHLRT